MNSLRTKKKSNPITAAYTRVGTVGEREPDRTDEIRARVVFKEIRRADVFGGVLNKS